MLTPDQLTEGLEDLKRMLIAMRPDEFEASQFEGTRREMSGIRLQLKRLEWERLADDRGHAAEPDQTAAA
jgi:hypothetical protein